MNNDRSDHPQNGSCLTRAEMSAYIRGNLTAKEEHSIERHLLDCELCSDAMEGLTTEATKEGFFRSDDEIKSGIDHFLQTEEKGRKRVLFLRRMAAAIVLLFISSLVLWLVIPKKDISTYITQDYEPYPAPPGTAATSEILQTPADVVNSDQRIPIAVTQPEKNLQHKDQALSEKSVAQETLPPDQNRSKSVSGSDEITLTKKEDVSETVATAGNTEEIHELNNSREMEADQIKGTAAIPSPSVQTATEEMTSLKKNAASSYSKKYTETGIPNEVFFNSGMEAYRNRDYTTAILNLEKSKKATALFYLGVSHWLTENPHVAISTFEKYLKSGETTYQEAAWWYMALSALKISDEKLAKKALKNVIGFHAEFEQQANDLLKKL